MLSKANSFLHWGAFLGTPILQSLAKSMLLVVCSAPSVTSTPFLSPLLSPGVVVQTGQLDPVQARLSSELLCSTGNTHPGSA